MSSLYKFVKNKVPQEEFTILLLPQSKIIEFCFDENSSLTASSITKIFQYLTNNVSSILTNFSIETQFKKLFLSWKIL